MDFRLPSPSLEEFVLLESAKSYLLYSTFTNYSCYYFYSRCMFYVNLVQVYQRAEVQQHLPAQSFTFSSVDKEWRELVESATANPSVMAVCLKEGTYTMILQEAAVYPEGRNVVFEATFRCAAFCCTSC